MVTLSATAVFALGVAVGMIVGVAGLCIIAVIASKKNK
jgi:hypothetical protein